jgi:NADH-quinone oxidoreductase subunit G
MNKGAGLYFHPVGDPVVKGYAKNIMQIENKPGSEEAVLYLLLDLFGNKEELPKEIIKILDGFKETNVILEKKTVVKKEIKDDEEIEIKEEIEEEVEITVNKLYNMIGLPDDFDTKLDKFLAKKDKFSLILGEDLYTHKRAKNIALLAGLIEKYSDFDVIIIPPQTNSLGVSLICDLDSQEGEYTIGYNVQGDFTISALGDGDLDMPALNQQEGTFVNIDKRVVPTNAAVAYKGYTLNDIANELGLKAKYTIDYTKVLPKSKGFKEVDFDDLPNYFDNGGNEHRGYLLENRTRRTKLRIPEDIDEIESFDGVVVYRCEPVLQFSRFTNKTKQLKSEGALFVSEEFMESQGLNENDEVEISNEYASLITKVKFDDKITGTIPYLPTFDEKLDVSGIFKGGYRYAKVNLKKV